MYTAYPRLGTPAIAILTFIYPLVAILIDWSIYGHPLAPLQGVGLILIAGCTIGFRLGWSLPAKRSSPRPSCEPDSRAERSYVKSAIGQK